MPMKNVTDIVMNEEAKELQHMVETNPEAKAAYDQFEAECKLRRELAEARKAQNLTQADVQERTGLTQQVISRIEKDNEISPSLKNLIKYVSAIGYELTLQPKQK